MFLWQNNGVCDIKIDYECTMLVYDNTVDYDITNIVNIVMILEWFITNQLMTLQSLYDNTMFVYDIKFDDGTMVVWCHHNWLIVQW